MQESVKEERYKYIGGSDIPIIMGISPFKTRYDLLLEKAQIKDNGFDGNEYTEYGNIMEGKIRDYINRSEGKPFLEDKVIDDDLRYHSDGFNGNCVLEIKTTSKIHNTVDEYKNYLVQLLFGMQMHNVKKGKLAVYARPEDFNETLILTRLRTFDIDIKDYKDLLEEINKAVEQFRIDLEKVKENPLITEEELQPKEILELSCKVVELETQIGAYKQLEAQYKELKAKLYEEMIKHQIKKWTTNNGVQITRVDGSTDTVTMVEKFNEELFKTDHPKTYKKYLIEEKQIKKGRSGYVKVTLP